MANNIHYGEPSATEGGNRGTTPWQCHHALLLFPNRQRCFIGLYVPRLVSDLVYFCYLDL